MFHVLASTHNWTNLTSSTSLSLLHNPLMGFTIWLGWISSGLTWTLLPNDLLDLHKIYENLLHHRSNNLDYLIARSIWKVNESLFGVQLNIQARNHRNLWCSIIAASEAEDNCNPPSVTFKFCNIYTLPTRLARNFTWVFLKTSIRSPSELKLNLFPCKALREMRLYLDSGTWRTPWR